MLSAQRDRLRAIADDLFCMDYNDYASEVRDAADTIWSLRNKLNDMLDQGDEIAQLKAENAKLRELIQKVWKWEKNGCHECPLESDCEADSVYDGDCGMAAEIENEMRKLGIEVG